MCLRNIKHPNILECFGYSYVEGNFTVILQLSEDGSLDKVIRCSQCFSICVGWLLKGKTNITAAVIYVLPIKNIN